jgi:hypothetical protein
MSKGLQFLLLVSLLVVLPATAQTPKPEITVESRVPAPIAERTATHFGRSTRVSLFSNRVVAVSIHSETESYLHRATLEYDEYMVYLQAIHSAASSIGNQPVGSDVESRDSVTELVVYVGPDAPRSFRYSPLASLHLAVDKIDGVMDDLQNRALDTFPGEYEIRSWQPTIGDCVELRQGGEACVIEVGEDETIVLRREDVAMTYTVAKENRAEVILRLIATTP